MVKCQNYTYRIPSLSLNNNKNEIVNLFVDKEDFYKFIYKYSK
jgi:hypothetical protein